MSDVSRSMYQKLKEENKKLLIDIRILCNPLPDERFMPTLKKWRKKFIKESQFNQMLKEVCQEYIKEHPEYDITKLMEEKKKATI